MSIVAGLSMSCCSLLWIIIGGYILKLTFADNDCFSRWWPRAMAIIFIIQGLCLLIPSFVSMFGGKDIDNSDISSTSDQPSTSSKSSASSSKSANTKSSSTKSSSDSKSSTSSDKSSSSSKPSSTEQATPSSPSTSSQQSAK